MEEERADEVEVAAQEDEEREEKKEEAKISKYFLEIFI